MFRWNRRPWMVFDADAGGSEGGPNPQGNDQAEYTPTGILPDDVVEGLRNLIDRRDGDTSQALELLYRDNFNLREQLRALRGQLPQDGQRVVDAADADALTAYRELGEIDALRQSLQDLDDLRERVAQAERDALIREVAEIAGYKPSVLAEIGRDLQFEIAEVQDAGGTRRVANVKDGDRAIPIHDWMKSNRADFLPALAVEKQPPAGNGPRPKPSAQGGQGQEPLTPLISIRSRF